MRTALAQVLSCDGATHPAQLRPGPDDEHIVGPHPAAGQRDRRLTNYRRVDSYPGTVTLYFDAEKVATGYAAARS